MDFLSVLGIIFLVFLSIDIVVVCCWEMTKQSRLRRYRQCCCETVVVKAVYDESGHGRRKFRPPPQQVKFHQMQDNPRDVISESDDSDHESGDDSQHEIGFSKNVLSDSDDEDGAGADDPKKGDVGMGASAAGFVGRPPRRQRPSSISGKTTLGGLLVYGKTNTQRRKERSDEYL